MAKKITEKKTKVKTPAFIAKFLTFIKNRQVQTVIGIFFLLLSLFLLISFISFFFSWQEDQSTLTEFASRNITSKNLLGKSGAKLSHFFIYNGFGLAAFILVFLTFITGASILLKTKLQNLLTSWNWGLLNMIFISIAIGFVSKKNALFSGIIGYEINDYIQDFIGKIGLGIVLAFVFISYAVVRFKITPEKVSEFFKRKEELVTDENITETASISEKNIQQTSSKENNTSTENKTTVKNSIITEEVKPKETATVLTDKSNFELSLENLQPTIDKHSEIKNDKPKEETLSFQVDKSPEEETITDKPEAKEQVEIAITKVAEEKSVTENLSDKLIADFGEFDPTLELGNYKFPTFNLLKEYNETISVDPTELEANKDRIVDTLKNYKIGIDKIKATVGPTITLYEIVPEAGIRISKIKNLEDDIALSLSALGIRIIAPIPGKGTIGIEVPNNKASIVSMHSVISSKKFQESPMELPIAFGKTISNETFVVDLAKMPHLLMAGATGQGKSVGLNAILTSLLYKKHPAEVKFVLVDPKKVELTLFNKIERHY